MKAIIMRLKEARGMEFPASRVYTGNVIPREPNYKNNTDPQK
jgi:hypothetical protein